MSSEVVQTENFSMPCYEGNDWEPSIEELEQMYLVLDGGGELQLEWSCPGRRPPTPTDKEINESKEVVKEVDTRNKEFDFMDELSQTPQMRIRGANATPKGSAKKKTTNFAGVLDSMKKHGRLSAVGTSASSGGGGAGGGSTTTTPTKSSNETT